MSQRKPPHKERKEDLCGKSRGKERHKLRAMGPLVSCKKDQSEVKERKSISGDG